LELRWQFLQVNILNNMTKVLAATVGAQIAIIMIKRVNFANRNVNKVLPATVGAQIAFFRIKSVSLF
jgi:uncharacterized membrane protein YeaQ/YmgE (transglycosylase-associated protein family)